MAYFVPVLDRWRMTFTYRLINAARNVILLVTGDDKAGAVARILAGEKDTDSLPASGLDPDKPEHEALTDNGLTP